MTDFRFNYLPTPPQSASAKAWDENFVMQVHCRHCEATFTYEGAVIGREKVPNRHQRTVTIYAPESCPECSSLHLSASPSQIAIPPSESAE